MFSWYKYLIVGFVFSHLSVWSGNLFLIAPFPDLCLFVPFDGYSDQDDADECNDVNDNDQKMTPLYILVLNQLPLLKLDIKLFHGSSAYRNELFACNT